MAKKGVSVYKTIDIDKELKNKGLSTNNASRLDDDGEKCVETIKNIVIDQSY